MQANPALRQRVSAWRQAIGGPARFALQATGLAVTITVALVARQGTSWTRGGALAGGLCVAIAGLGWWWFERRSRTDARRQVRRVIAPTDPLLGQRALRAARLFHRLELEGAAAPRSFAAHHLQKLIEGTSVEQVRQAAQRRARIYRGVGGVVALVALGVGILRGREIAEGVDVLVARGPRAPWPMLWTDRLRIQAQPPAYLRSATRVLYPGAVARVPKGTHLTLRAGALFPSRQLVVTDGEHESPFVSDGEGGLVAHYTVEADAVVIAAARFGRVLIPEPDALTVSALEDAAPSVHLEDAPVTYRLNELERLELRWSAADDHGLKQVDLVLRSGSREERRVLGTYEEETPEQHGGHVLLATDPFLRSLYLPAQVSVEARDNDPVNGSKWGKSQLITIVPTAVGEPDAARYLALVRARDRFVDALGVAETQVRAADDRESRAERFTARLDGAVKGLESALDDSYGGLRVPNGLRAFALGRLRLLTAQHNTVRERTPLLEDLVLALDAALGSLSTRDAQRVAKVLGDVAEEAMVSAEQARAPESSGSGVERLDKAIVALRGGAEQLLELGTLGNDLGSVALADLGRVAHGREQNDFYHAELAARHLAERLRRPVPSFGASSSGGVEAGQSGSGGGEPSESSSGAPRAFDELAAQIAELARQHAGAVEQVDQTLSDAKSAPGNEALRAEAERRAGALRDAVEGLPEPGNSPGTPEADAALAREHARAMAHQLESLKLGDAAESARRALSALEDAAGRADPGARPTGLENARAVVEEQQRWVQSQLDESRQAARDRARQSLQGPAALEDQLAGTAQQLAQRGDQRSTPLPGEVTERLRQADQLMRQASRNLASGEGDAGLALQRQAQRLLEIADQGKTSDSEPGAEGEPSDADGTGKAAAFGGDVPNAAQQNKAEEFRRRVLKSLGESPGGRLGPAVKRYAEGLLR